MLNEERPLRRSSILACKPTSLLFDTDDDAGGLEGCGGLVASFQP